VIEVRQTEAFSNWIRKLRDDRARQRIQIRIRRLSLGNFGDVRSVGIGVSELRIDYGPGYRVYFHQRAAELVLLLAGGDKTTQDSDIVRAKRILKEVENAD